eukprot:CAMPEP_0117518694 /NCGR_PEP_ID=MMETSP0784-20121206/32265_1 /TAXON_ID=39447 /ORGANISM="" /LENGTH=75 /DNA_ID=CAMNT_0005314625 /DNA_START=56 /DNA_END=283 /DNA_ORIENTATION=-
MFQPLAVIIRGDFFAAKTHARRLRHRWSGAQSDVELVLPTIPMAFTTASSTTGQRKFLRLSRLGWALLGCACPCT